LRADARLNHEKLLAAAREAFGEHGATASLEEVARRAQVGIATLYRNFPSRRDLLEAVYVEEFEALSQSAADLAGLPPWDALAAWLHRFAEYAVTHRALAEELIASLDDGGFQRSREVIAAAGERLLQRAQAAGVARGDVAFDEVERMVGGIATIRGAEPGQIARILDIALDGLRPRPTDG
jgi:AcrR family transcriptional regulator